MNADSSNAKNGKCANHKIFEEHLDDFKEFAEHTSVIHEIVTNIHGDTKYLNQLPVLVNAVNLMVGEVKLLRESLIAPATNKNFLPLIAVVPLLACMAFAMAVLGGLLLVHMSDDRALKISPSSIEILK